MTVNLAQTIANAFYEFESGEPPRDGALPEPSDGDHALAANIALAGYRNVTDERAVEAAAQELKALFPSLNYSAVHRFATAVLRAVERQDA